MDEHMAEPVLTTFRTNDHEIRQMRFETELLTQQVKGLHKALGKAGAKIHELRCQLAESREINGAIARGQYRDLQREVDHLAEMVEHHVVTIHNLAECNRELKEKLKATESLVDYTHGGSDV